MTLAPWGPRASVWPCTRVGVLPLCSCEHASTVPSAMKKTFFSVELQCATNTKKIKKDDELLFSVMDQEVLHDASESENEAENHQKEKKAEDHPDGNAKSPPVSVSDAQ